MIFKKKFLFKLLALFYLFSVQVALSNTFLYSHDTSICKTDVNDSDLDCISHCSLEQMENLDNSINTFFLKNNNLLINDLELTNQFYFLIAQKSHSPPYRF